MCKYGDFSGPYFPIFGLDTKIYRVNVCIQSKYGKIRIRKNSVFGHFSRCEKRNIQQCLLKAQTSSKLFVKTFLQIFLSFSFDLRDLIYENKIYVIACKIYSCNNAAFNIHICQREKRHLPIYNLITLFNLSCF